MTQGVEHQSTLSIQIYLHLKSYLFLEDECLISPTQCLNVYIILVFFYEMIDEYFISVHPSGPKSLYCYSVVENKNPS